MQWLWHLKHLLRLPAYVPWEVQRFHAQEKTLHEWQPVLAAFLEGCQQEHPEAWERLHRLGMIPYLTTLPPLPPMMLREILWRWWQLASLLPATYPLLNPHHEGTLRCLEVGVKDWAVLPAMAGGLHWLKHHTDKVHRKGDLCTEGSTPERSLVLDGVEIAPWQFRLEPYQLVSRYETAQYVQRMTQPWMQHHHACALQSQYIPQSIQGWVARHHDRSHASGHAFGYDLLAVFLPFVHPETHARWGLAKHWYQPTTFWQSIAACQHRSHPTVLWVTHQGTWEQEAFDTWYAETPEIQESLPIVWHETQVIHPHWVPLRYAHVVRVGTLLPQRS
ncbi:MAG: hypothetical protein ACKO37_03790 [Vampirovibrionales bacterium]